jgi:5-methylthioadenosine/S-adenosylhomocysteine deaminase
MRSLANSGWVSIVFTVLAILSAWHLTFADDPPRYTLRATLVTPARTIDDGVIRWSGGHIETVASGSATDNAINVDGVVFPGLIDLHNHLTWNVLPRWTPPHVFSNRYEWLELPDYTRALSGPHYALTAAGLGCVMNRYAEIKALVHGATATVGSLSISAENACILGLVRNLDFASGLENQSAVNRERLRNFVFPFELSAEEENAVRNLDPVSPPESGKLRAVVMHLAEGTDAASRREFRMFKQHGYIRKG